jgi:hypothetical protein
MSACFVNIATMNARRKDEIRHPKFGLQKGNLAVVDEILGIFTVNFYIEKTYLQRMPFYVNRSTCDAIKILESLEELFSRMESIIKPQQKLSSESRPLFSYRRISTKRGVLANRRWYDFTNFAHDADAKLFLRCALGNESSFSIKAHMFRRMYALLMMYRYENGDLQSAMYQLGHFDANMTMLYVTDPSGRPAMEQISQTIGNTNRELRAVIYEEHARTIHKEIRQVGEEKFVEDVYQILTGEVAHGGYTKYIRRLQINLSKQIRFATLSTEEKANELVRVAKTRGHFPKPMPHGQCMAGGARNIHMAKCHSNNENRLQHELASHETCNGCVFHLTKMAYLRNLEGELQLLRTHMATDPVRDCGKSPYQAEVENLELVLNLMSSRLMGDASA